MGRPSAAGELSPRIVLGLGALLVGAVAIAAIVLSQGGGSPGASSSTLPPPSGNATPATGRALPAFDTTTNDSAVGQPIPEVDGRSFDGSSVAIKADGKPKLLLFVAHWCPHCQREVPVVQAWINAGRLPATTQFISVATAIDPNRPNYPPDAWLTREGWTPPVLVDSNGSIASLYGLTAFPYWVVVDASGRVVQRLTGELTREQLDVLAAAAAS